MKIKRQAKILELIRNEDIGTQEELSARLLEEGYTATQATISRDIRELELTKVTVDGHQKYAVPARKNDDKSDRLVRVLRDSFISMDTAGNILVVNTGSGLAMAAAAAIDSLDFPEIVGCIAGDDTIFCAIKDAGEAEEVMAKLELLIKAD